MKSKGTKESNIVSAYLPCRMLVCVVAYCLPRHLPPSATGMQKRHMHAT